MPPQHPANASSGTAAEPCELTAPEVGELEHRVRERMLRGAAPRIGTCEIARARTTERWQLREHGRLIAEVVFDCGIIAYDARLAYREVRVGMRAETALVDDVECSSGSFRIPADAFDGASDGDALVSCTRPRDHVVFVVRTDAAPRPSETLDREVARQLVRGRAIVAVHDFRCRE